MCLEMDAARLVIVMHFDGVDFQAATVLPAAIADCAVAIDASPSQKRSPQIAEGALGSRDH